MFTIFINIQLWYYVSEGCGLDRKAQKQNIKENGIFIFLSYYLPVPPLIKIYLYI